MHSPHAGTPARRHVTCSARRHVTCSAARAPCLAPFNAAPCPSPLGSRACVLLAQSAVYYYSAERFNRSRRMQAWFGHATPLAAGALTGLAHVRLFCAFFKREEGVALYHSAEREGGREGEGRDAGAEAEAETETDSQLIENERRLTCGGCSRCRACLPSSITGSTSRVHHQC